VSCTDHVLKPFQPVAINTLGLFIIASLGYGIHDLVRALI